MEEALKEYEAKKRASMAIAMHNAKIPEDHYPIVAKPCARCGTLEGVRSRPAATAYHWDGEGENPNAPVPLCVCCVEEYYEYYQDLWDTYHGG